MRVAFHYTLLGVATILILGALFVLVIDRAIVNDERLFAMAGAHEIAAHQAQCPRSAIAVPTPDGWRCRITNPGGEFIDWSPRE